MSPETLESQWSDIKNLAEQQRFEDLHRWILQFNAPAEQVATARWIVRSLMFREWSPKQLTPLIEIADGAIHTAFEAGDREQANVLCFNMSANLAGCWEDGFTRTELHFQKGLQYAERALEFRRELQKGPHPFALAYWAKGIHHLFLRQNAEAETSFQKSLDAALEEARENHQPADPNNLTAETSFNVLIAAGYLALSQQARGLAEGKEKESSVIQSFQKWLEADPEQSAQDPEKVLEKKEDAQIGLQQLAVTRKFLALS